MMEARRIVTPLRFVAVVIGLWTVARLAILLPDTPPPALGSPARADAYVPPRRLPAATVFSAAMVERAGRDASILAVPLLPGRRPDAPSSQDATPIMATASLGSTFGTGLDDPNVGTRSDPSPSGLIAPAAAPSPATSRWSGNLYLFRRGAGGTTAIASGGQLGGSQAGARIAYRLDAAGSLAAAGRLSSPLDDARAAEGAVGLDWHPIPAAPLRLSIERRVDLGGNGRNAWSAYAAGGFWRQHGSLVVDGYAQAGVVGARRRDMFADGAIRAGYRAELGGGRMLTLGAGAWGAAQPRVERIDVGPRAALGVNVDGTPLSVAVEWRLRVVGDAAPGSGLALTVAADF